MAVLRSVFEPGSNRWAMRRAQWMALGIQLRPVVPRLDVGEHG